MGIFRRNGNGNPDGRKGPDLSFLLVPLTVLLLIFMIAGIGVWGWNTIRNGRERIVAEAFMDTFTITVKGSADYKDYGALSVVKVGFAGCDMDATGIIDTLRSYGIRPYSSEDDLRKTGNSYTGSMRFRFRGVDSDYLTDVAGRVISDIPGFDGYSIYLESEDQKKSDIEAIRMAFSNAKKNGLEYLNNVFGIEDGVVTSVDSLEVDYDSATGITHADVMITFRTGGKDV